MTVTTRFAVDQLEAIGPNRGLNSVPAGSVPLAPACECPWCETVQYNMACAGLSSLPEYMPLDLAERIGVAGAERSMRIAAVSGTFNMIHPDLEVRCAGLRRLHVLAGACAAFGTRTITLCTGTRDPDDMWRAHPRNGDKDAWRDLLASLEAAVAIAEEFDVSLGIEPETANVVDSARQALRLLRDMRSPRFEIVIDPANLFGVDNLARQHDVLDEAFDLLGSYLVMAHAKDMHVVDGEIRHVAAGTGLLDNPYYLSLLSNVPVPLVLHGLSEDEVPSSLAFLRSMNHGRV